MQAPRPLHWLKQNCAIRRAGNKGRCLNKLRQGACAGLLQGNARAPPAQTAPRSSCRPSRRGGRGTGWPALAPCTTRAGPTGARGLPCPRPWADHPPSDWAGTRSPWGGRGARAGCRGARPGARAACRRLCWRGSSRLRQRRRRRLCRESGAGVPWAWAHGLRPCAVLCTRPGTCCVYHAAAAPSNPPSRRPPAQWESGKAKMLSQPTPADRLAGWGPRSKPCCSCRCAQCRFRGCRQFQPCQPAGAVGHAWQQDLGLGRAKLMPCYHHQAHTPQPPHLPGRCTALTARRRCQPGCSPGCRSCCRAVQWPLGCPPARGTAGTSCRACPRSAAGSLLSARGSAGRCQAAAAGWLPAAARPAGQWGTVSRAAAGGGRRRKRRRGGGTAEPTAALLGAPPIHAPLNGAVLASSRAPAATMASSAAATGLLGWRLGRRIAIGNHRAPGRALQGRMAAL